MFEGEFKNGEKNGKLNQYFNKKLIFEGEYLYGYKRKGKEIINGNIEYEGEYFNNKKYNGKGYDENGNIIYELISGNGKVKEYANDKLIFEGEYINGKRWNGNEKEYNDEGELINIVEYINGKRKT